MCLKLVIFLVFLNSLFAVLVRSDERIVKTSSGTVKGLTVHALNKSIDQFLGIPYAEPPVGSLRFAKPKPITKPIEGIIDATKAKHSCFQKESLTMVDKGVSEDCLTLNIWSPKLENNNSTKLNPVMFWIYGGALKSGSINIPIYNGSVLASHDVVFVSVNYRLGHLGFLYGGDVSTPGNAGFYDQLLGLKWVRENIHLFGGDKNQITIFGESAGSWSVSAHVLSPLSKGLFKRAIMESGAHLYNKNRSVVSKAEALNQAKQLAKRVNCTDDKQWLECLRKKDAKQLLPSSEFIFPTEGTEFLPVSAQKAFSTLNYNKDIDLIAGVVHDEGPSLAKGIFSILKGNFSKIEFDALIAFSDSIYHNIDKEKAIKFYLDNVDTKNSSAMVHAFYDYFGDIVIKCPTYHFAKQFAKHSPNTYFYELTYEGKMMSMLGCDEKTMGICHGADIEFVFGIPFGSLGFLASKIDADFSIEVMKMWTNFAKTGNPGGQWPTVSPQVLPQVGHNATVIKNLNPHDLKGVLIDPFKKECDGLWKDYFE